MRNPQLADFEKQSYLNLETFRKSGAGIQTPVWFAEQDGILYVRTIDGSGKVKRIRYTQQVRIAPCNARGDLLGEWVEAKAWLVHDAAQEEQANRVISRKYGWQKRLFDWFNALQKAKWVTIAIEVA